MADLVNIKLWSREKPEHVFSIYIRSSADQTDAVERVQIVALNIIFGKDYPIKEDGHLDFLEAARVVILNKFVQDWRTELLILVIYV